MYGLQSAWLNQAERRRINSFHARCLRVILKIPCSYISRISNAVVLARAQAEPLSTCLLRQQLRYFGKLAGRDNENPGRACIFEPGGLGDVTPVGVRRRGRPRLEWSIEMRKHAALAAGSQQLLEAISFKTDVGKRQWRAHVNKYVPTYLLFSIFLVHIIILLMRCLILARGLSSSSSSSSSS